MHQVLENRPVGEFGFLAKTAVDGVISARQATSHVVRKGIFQLWTGGNPANSLLTLTK